MPEPTLSIDWTELKEEVAHFLGYGRDSTKWGTRSTTIERVVQSGYRQFIFPPMIDEQKVPYEWNFLFLETVSLNVASVSFLAAPDNFGGIAKDFVVKQTPANRHKLEMVDYQTIQSLGTGASGVPKYVAVVPTDAPGLEGQDSIGQRYEFRFFPGFDAGLQLDLHYRYNVIPDALTDETPYPYGGGKHSETILESCLAVAEHRKDDTADIHQQRFMALLRASIEIDKRENRKEGRVYPQGAKNITADLTFADLVREVGAYLGFDFDQSSWTDEQQQHVDFIVQSGIRQFYAPPPIEGQQQAHDWDFLKPIDTLPLFLGQVKYILPDGFGTIIGDLTFSNTAA